MLYYLHLGQNGRLGNQMFQLAVTYSQAKRLKTKCGIPNEGHDLFQLFEMNDEDIVGMENISPKFSYIEPFFRYDKNILNLPDECNVHGYLQSEKYFEDYKQDILNLFKFKDHILNAAKIQLNETSKSEKKCFIHIRRGDAIGKELIHPFPGDDYYKNSINLIEKMDKNVEFIVISDDIEWCQEYFKNTNYKIFFSKNPYVDLCAMSLCDHAIIANSTFSWWGAYLGPTQNNGIIISPKTWFGPQGPQDWQDIYCKNWICL